MFYAYLHKGMKLNQMLKKRTQNQHSFSWLFRKYKKKCHTDVRLALFFKI